MGNIILFFLICGNIFMEKTKKFNYNEGTRCVVRQKRFAAQNKVFVIEILLVTEKIS